MIVPEPHPEEIFAHALKKGVQYIRDRERPDDVWVPVLHPVRIYRLRKPVVSLTSLKKGWMRRWDCLLHDGANYLLVSMMGRRGQHHTWTWNVAGPGGTSTKSVMVSRMLQLVESERRSEKPSHIRLMFMPWYFLDVLWLTDGSTDRFWVFKQKFKLDRGPSWMDVEMSAAEFMEFMAGLREKQREAYKHMPRERTSLKGKLRSWRYKFSELFKTYL
jgi:hypothetical protein